MLKIAVLTLALSATATARELDHVGSKALKGAVVLRVDTRDQSVSMVSTQKKIQSKKDAQEFAKKARFTPVSKDRVRRSELDRESGSSSWYWYCGNSYNYLNWYGLQYPAAYTYNYGWYNYYYYTGWNWNWNAGWQQPYYGHYNPGWNGYRRGYDDYYDHRRERYDRHEHERYERDEEIEHRSLR